MGNDWQAITFHETDDATIISDKKKLLEEQISYLTSSIQQVIADW